MTSDAKIGLLLGLIFIFVIAFIINGLPSLRPQAKAEAVPGNVMPTQDENLGVADATQKANEAMHWDDLIDQQTEEPRGPVTTTKSVELTTPPQPEQTVAADGVSLMPSAGGIEKLTKGLGDIVQTLVQASGQAAAQEKTTEPAPSVDVAKQQAKSEPKVDLKPERTQAVDTAKLTKPVSLAASPATRTYTVVDGDTLGSIAKKAYGAEEGNRVINNQRIFEANRNILKTPNDIVVGQELVIPPPAKPKPKPDSVLPKTLFEKVEAIGKRQVPAPEKAVTIKETPAKTEPAKPPAATKKEPAKPAAGERWYTVQDGDNLWKIASSQLGSGARYEEIVKLNGDVLKEGVSVGIGMRLRLPSK
jgi:nucleoid-associated protein YgaU